MDYKNLTTKGILTKIEYRETRYANEVQDYLELVKPKDKVNLTRIVISENKGTSLNTEIMTDIPNSYIGKKVILKESLQTKKKIKTQTQELFSEGLPKIVTSINWKLKQSPHF